jgi:hypothetical protein
MPICLELAAFGSSSSSRAPRRGVFQHGRDHRTARARERARVERQSRQVAARRSAAAPSGRDRAVRECGAADRAADDGTHAARARQHAGGEETDNDGHDAESRARASDARRRGAASAAADTAAHTAACTSTATTAQGECAANTGAAGSAARTADIAAVVARSRHRRRLVRIAIVACLYICIRLSLCLCRCTHCVRLNRSFFAAGIDISRCYSRRTRCSCRRRASSGSHAARAVGARTAALHSAILVALGLDLALGLYAAAARHARTAAHARVRGRAGLDCRRFRHVAR